MTDTPLNTGASAAGEHPEYGPCDAWGPNGECSQCTGKVVRYDGRVSDLNGNTPAPDAGEVERLRGALIAMGRMIPGCVLQDTVSTDFLMLLPEEMRLWKERASLSSASHSAAGVPSNPKGPSDGLLAVNAAAIARDVALSGQSVDEAEAMREAAVALLNGWADCEDAAKKIAEMPADAGWCAVIAMEFRRAAKAIRALPLPTTTAQARAVPEEVVRLADFQWNEGWNLWEQVADGVPEVPWVITAYCKPGAAEAARAALSSGEGEKRGG